MATLPPLTSLLTLEICRFIEEHAHDDVRELAFAAPRYPHWDMSFVLDQIAGRQIAQRKLPTWAATPHVVYPPHLSMEQCSSEMTARYKARLAKRLLQENIASTFVQERTSFIDLTGGLGVDFSMMAQEFSSCIYVEQQPHLCQLARHNFSHLGLPHAIVREGSGIDILQEINHVDVIYIDPARRNEMGGKTVLINDCTPNILEHLNTFVNKAHHTIVKLSPMLHWQQAVNEINASGNYVCEVHIIAVKNECKELLFVLGKQAHNMPLKVYCVNNDEVFCCDWESVTQRPQRLWNEEITPNLYLYEPHAAVMKAGCFAEITHQWPVRAIAPNSHLFLSREELPQFSGRKFKILAISSLNKKELKAHLHGITQANITIRNFPMAVSELRKKIKIAEGGHTYIFATTTLKNEKCLLICEKAIPQIS